MMLLGVNMGKGLLVNWIGGKIVIRGSFPFGGKTLVQSGSILILIGFLKVSTRS
jgi:hypothetical protein